MGAPCHSVGVSDKTGDFGMEENKDWRIRCEKSDDAFRALMRKSGIEERTHTEPQTARPRMVFMSEVRTGSGWVYPAGERLVR